MNNIDDGSLSFLNIPRDEKSRSFNCDETSQSKLVNTTFWVVDYIEEVPTMKTSLYRTITIEVVKPGIRLYSATAMRLDSSGNIMKL